jgi:hypothetical protein
MVPLTGRRQAVCGISEIAQLAIEERSGKGTRGFHAMVAGNSKAEALAKAEQCRWAAEHGTAATPAGEALLIAGAALYSAIAEWIDE